MVRGVKDVGGSLRVEALDTLDAAGTATSDPSAVAVWSPFSHDLAQIKQGQVGVEAGRCATLWVRANHANLSRYLAEVTSLEEALERAERQRAQLGAGNERAELRLQHETEIMEHEMDLDFQQQASVQAARVLRELRSQLLHFVQQEESLCAEEEAQLNALHERLSETAKQQGVARVAPEAASFMQIAVTAHVHRMLAARAYNGAVPHGAFATWMWPPSQRTPVGAPDFSMYDAPPP